MTDPTGDLATLEHQVEILTEKLEEATLDAQRILGREDVGWASLYGDGEAVIDRDSIVAVSAVARVMVVADPLIKRGVNLRIAYLGRPEISADSGKDGGQDVNAVVQEFLDDPGNKDVFSSAQAVEERERGRATDGNNLHALVTNPRTGRVQVRHIPFAQVREIVTDPEDSALPWLYLREYSTKVVEQGFSGLTRTRSERRRVYYPDINFRPSTRPRSIDGIPVEWDKPVIHTVVNRPDGSRWGVPDTLAALPWAKGYKDALLDWAKHHKALASIAFRVAVQGRKGAAAVRARLPVGDEAGRTVIQGVGESFEAIKTTGALLPAEAAEPLAGLVAAALDVPKTMLLSDPGSTGARAVAETLDEPMKLDREARRELDTDLILSVLHHVVRESVRAPQGLLKGRVFRDPDTGREIVELANDQEPGISVDWPSLDKINVKEYLEGLSIVDGMNRIPALEIARLILLALDIPDPDEILRELTDDEGNFISPNQAELDRQASSVGYDGEDGNLPPTTESLVDER